MCTPHAPVNQGVHIPHRVQVHTQGRDITIGVFLFTVIRIKIIQLDLAFNNVKPRTGILSLITFDLGQNWDV